MARRAGIDVGGTKFLGVVMDDAGTVVTEHRRPTPKGSESLIEALVEFARGLGEWDSLGIGVPGLITRRGTLRASPNLTDVTELDVRGRVAAALGREVVVDNDATCATLAEWRFGAGRGSDDLVLVTLGTGIGGGIVSGGNLQRGANGFAGEIGHMVVDPDGPRCPCGRRGCWERYASGSALARLTREAPSIETSEVIRQAGGDVDAITGEHVVVAARAGDRLATSVVDDFARWIAIGLANLTNALDPSVLVLGGGLAASADVLVDPVKKWFSDLLYAPELRPHPSLEFAHFGERAGAIGAALLGSGISEGRHP